MEINGWSEIAVDLLRENSANPKKPMAKKCREGLRTMVKRFGFSDCLKVAENLDGSFLVLDGTTRLQDLKEAGTKSVLCVLVPLCKEGEVGWEESRKEFVLGFDRNRKRFDEEVALAQLQDLASRGRDVDLLAKISAKPNLEKLLDGINQRVPPQSTVATQPKVSMASLVLYGPCDALAEIREMVSRVKSSFDNLAKVKKILAQSIAYLNWDDDRFLACLLYALKKFEDGHEGQKTETNQAENSERKSGEKRSPRK